MSHRWLALCAGGLLTLATPCLPAAAQRPAKAPSRSAPSSDAPSRDARAAAAPPAAFSGDEFVHESWNVSDGLPVNSINELIQTNDGYIWAATFDGLVRFDGVRFTVFNTANSTGLPSDRIIHIEEGINGDLWLLTEQRHIVRWRKGRFTLIAPPTVTSPDNQPLLIEADGSAWVGTNNGLARVVGDLLVPVLRDQIRDTVLSMRRLRDRTLLLGLATRGTVRVRTLPNGRLEPFSQPADSLLSGARVNSVFEEPGGMVWLGSTKGIYRGLSTWERVPTVPDVENYYVGNIVANPQGSGVVIYGYRLSANVDSLAASTLATSSGRQLSLMATGRTVTYARPLWTSGDTIWHAAANTVYRNQQPVFSLGTDNPRNVAAIEITTGLTDREGSIWLGTFASGLHRLKPTLVHTVSVPEGLPDRNVYATYVDPAGMVWAGSWTRGLSRIDPVSGRVQGFGSSFGLPLNVRSMLMSRDGALWVGSSGVGVWLNRCAVAMSVLCTAEGGNDESLVEVSALFEDIDGRLWIGANSGLFRRDNGRVARLDPTTTGAPRSPVRAFAATPDGAIWMGTNGGGVVRYREGVFTTITSADGLPGDVIRALYVDADGWLWIGTEGRGLARIDPKGWGALQSDPQRRRIARISTRDGLFDNVIHQILEDDTGRLWMNTNRGIFWIARAEALSVANGTATRVHATGYTERDGMRNREGNGGVQPAGAKGRDGRLWFPTQDGVVVVNPKDVEPATQAPPLIVEQVVAGDSTLLPIADSIRLSPTQRDIRIEFTALTYLAPQNVRFRYQLNGYDDAWVDGETRRNAFYTKLPPGSYTFRVQASANGSEWYEPGATLSIRVMPRFYETAWFLAVAGLGLLALLVAGIQRRVRDARRRARDLERVVAERTATIRDREHQLEVQNELLEHQAGSLRDLDRARSRFFANVSHELRTPLTLMIAPMERLRTEIPLADQRGVWLDLAQRNARRLLELVNQILDVAKLEAGAMRLSPRRVDLCALLRGTLDSFQLAAERKHLRLRMEGPASCEMLIDSDAVEKIVTNLLSNAVKFTPPDGEITLGLQRRHDRLLITVANTGPVVPLEKLALVFERFHSVDESNTTIQPGTGIGLSLVKELVELQRGTVRAVSNVEATTFTVELPLAAGAIEDLTEHGTVDPTDGSSVEDVESPNAGPESDIPTLLIVDDSEDMRTFLRMNFESRFRVIEAGDGEEALTLARARLPDVVISDVMMPRLDGRGLVQALRASPETDFLAVILLTAQADDEQRITGLEGGADDYLVKPFEMRELDVRVRNLIAARQRLRVRFGDDGHALAPLSGTTSSLATSTASLDAATKANTPPDAPSLSPDDAAYRRRVWSAISAGLSDADFGVAELADAVFQDRSHLFRRVRQVMETTPSDLLRRLRAEEGARLLRESSGSVADVAFSVGFRSVSHFYRCFQERFGMTPAEYRAGARRQ